MSFAKAPRLHNKFLLDRLQYHVDHNNKDDAEAVHRAICREGDKR